MTHYHLCYVCRRLITSKTKLPKHAICEHCKKTLR